MLGSVEPSLVKDAMRDPFPTIFAALSSISKKYLFWKINNGIAERIRMKMSPSIRAYDSAPADGPSNLASANMMKGVRSAIAMTGRIDFSILRVRFL